MGLPPWYPSQEVLSLSPITHISLCVIIPTYRRSYGRAHVVQISGVVGLAEGGSSIMVSEPEGLEFSSATRNNSHLPHCSLTT
jgi:hypothetical protein